MFPEVGNAGGDPLVAQAKDDHAGAGQHHRDDGDDLDQGEPELELTEGTHGDQVHPAHADQRRQGPDPARHVREPDAHINSHGGDFRHAGHQPEEPVVPAGKEARQRAEVVLGVAAEGAGHRVVHGHLAEGAHDHQDGEAADDVGEHDGRTGHLDGLGRTEEQADANAGAQGHQADVTLTEVSVQRFMLWLMISNRHGDTSSCSCRGVSRVAEKPGRGNDPWPPERPVLVGRNSPAEHTRPRSAASLAQR
ncbi:hypothetical protein D9M71_205320 [compost metagenome]